MAGEIRKRNVFVRHSWENNFYYQRALSLAGKTIIEVFRPGQPRDITDDAASASNLIEILTVLSKTVAVPRSVFQRQLGISARQRTEVDLVIGPSFHYLRSRVHKAPRYSGLPIDKTDVARFQRIGFCHLYAAASKQNAIGLRLQRCASWLYESRREPHDEAAIVKTAIALESLLILTASEPLARSLAERAAFLLSPKPDTRKPVARLIGRLYEARSTVVHGGRKQRRTDLPRLLEAGDRLAVLLLLVVAANGSKWGDEEAFRAWLHDERWGPPARIVLPFAPTALRIVKPPILLVLPAPPENTITSTPVEVPYMNVTESPSEESKTNDTLAKTRCSG